MADVNPLSETHPALAAEWHPTLNDPLNPDTVTASHARYVWWACDQGHAFRSLLNERARYRTGCPVCANKTVRPGVNDLVTTDSELAGEWHPTLNGDLVPDLVAPGYKGEVWWNPACGHWFSRTPLQRQSDRRCPVCVDDRVYPGQNDLATVHPELVGDLDVKQGLDPRQIRATSRQRDVRWLRPCGHSYTTSPGARHEDPTPPACGTCNPTKPATRATLPMVADVPWMLALWDCSANQGLDPAKVKAGDNRTLVAWRCSESHSWSRRPRTQKEKCGFCSGQELLAGVSDLATINPVLASQWHPTRNPGLTPEQVLPKANKMVWWLGPCGHEWEAKIANRSNGAGCPSKCPGTRVLPS